MKTRFGGGIMKKGDMVNYSGQLTGEAPRKNCIIESIDRSGKIFNQPMATLVDVPFWVSLAELSIAEKNLKGGVP